MNEETENRSAGSGCRAAARLPRTLTLTLLVLFGVVGCAQFQPLLEPFQAQTVETDDEGDGADDATEQTAAAGEEPAPVPPPQEEPEPGQLYDWNGNGRSVTRVIIDTDAQRARFYSGSEQVGWTTVATGLPSHATPSGEFVILEKAANKRSNLYGKIVDASGNVIKHGADSRDGIPPGGRFVGARMPNFMRMTYDGIGMHAGPIPSPGQPASHGCIRMPKKVASAVFRQIEPGTPVTVIGSGPDYGNYAERVRQRQLEEEARRAAAEAAEDGTALDALDAEVETMRQSEAAGDAADSGVASAAPDPAGAAEEAPADQTAPGSDGAPDAQADAPNGETPQRQDAAPAENGGGEDERDYYRPPAPPPQIRSAAQAPEARRLVLDASPSRAARRHA